jgi:predicted MFS family arabinose efflux permease
MLVRAVLMQMSLPMLENFSMLVSPPEEQGAIASLRGIGWQSGQAIGIFLSGLVQSQFGFPPIFIATSLCYLFAIGMTWFYFRPHEKSATHAG